MRLPLHSAACLLAQLASPPSPSEPPLVFIDDEPFLVELQGSLEAPTGEECAGEEASKAGAAMEGVRVGKVDLADPKKPILRIAHHRLEGKLETLPVPFALLRTTRSAPSSSSASASASPSERPAKRPRLAAAAAAANPESNSRVDAEAEAEADTRGDGDGDGDGDGYGEEGWTRVSIVAVIRRKLVFSKRPEPLVDVSSEADPLFADKKRQALAAGAGQRRPPKDAGAAAAAGGARGFFAPKKRGAAQDAPATGAVGDKAARAEGNRARGTGVGLQQAVSGKKQET
ncbi:hypothetical protein JCM3770_005349 [Rhodotorula araucariae]